MEVGKNVDPIFFGKENAIGKNVGPNLSFVDPKQRSKKSWTGAEGSRLLTAAVLMFVLLNLKCFKW